MSVNPPEGTLTIENSHLDVKGNVSAVALKLGTLRLTPSYGLDAVANVSNSTTHTLELSNATTGLVTTANVVVGKDLAVSGNATVSSNLTVSGNATVSSNLTVTGNATVSSNLTVSGNATVTGDLNVSGALGILDAIYPVGTVIDRATAITDTHLNGKYKAFLTAPNQEWELMSSNEVPLEFLSQLGNSSSFCGRATMIPATTIQQLTEAHTAITGSTVTDFLPVVGTKRIKYSFSFMFADWDTNPLANFNIEFQEGSGSWQTVTESHSIVYYGISGINPRHMVSVSWTFVLDDVNNASVGSIATERPTLGFRVTGREYVSSNEAQVHVNINYLPTDNSSTNINKFRVPIVDIISLGIDPIKKYQRTV